MTLVDTNVLLDVLSNDPMWFDWSVATLAERGSIGPLLINEAVFAEMAARMDTRAKLDSAIRGLEVNLERIPVDALFLAGQAFKRYRNSGGVRTGVLPDFFVGAHAQAAGLALLTRDLRRYRTYFPKVKLIAPDI
jgi:hypothetical protein